MCAWCTTRWRQTIMKITRTRRSPRFNGAWTRSTMTLWVFVLQERSTIRHWHKSIIIWFYKSSLCICMKMCFVVCLGFFLPITCSEGHKLGFCMLPDHFILFVEWVSEWQGKQDASTCVHSRGQGHWVSLTFESMSITSYRRGRRLALSLC